MSCIIILASMRVLYKFYLHNKMETVCMVVLVVGSESSQNWVRVVSGLGPIRLGSEKYQGSELSWVRVVRLPCNIPSFVEIIPLVLEKKIFKGFCYL